MRIDLFEIIIIINNNNMIFLAENAPRYEPRAYQYSNVNPDWISAKSRPKHYQLLKRSDFSSTELQFGTGSIVKRTVTPPLQQKDGAKMRNLGKRSFRLRNFIKYHLDN